MIENINNVALVYELQKAILADLKCKLPLVCAGQYKNREKFYDHCQHKSDIGLSASWVLFWH